MKAPPETFRDRLRADLDEIEARLHSLIAISEIHYVNPNRPGGDIVFIGAADWGWKPSDEQQMVARMELDRLLTYWEDRFAVLAAGATHEIAKRADNARTHLRKWVERKSKDTSIPRTVDEAKVRASQWIDDLRWSLDVLSEQGEAAVRVVPDTSALMRNPDVASYAASVGAKAFVVHLLPTVLGEIDNNKDQGRTQEARERAMKASRRIKGWQDKGKLTEGVNVTRTIAVKAEVRSPSFAHVPDWLQPSVPDDQILASILELQAREPQSTVILVASDMNIRNKAEALGIPFVDTPVKA